jgi:hypothetical protein
MQSANISVSYSGQIIKEAYHGTSETQARLIIEYGFNKSTGERQYLGDGVYFFESSKSQARMWGRQRKYDHVVVLKAVVELKNCLDFTDFQTRKDVGKFAANLQRKFSEKFGSRHRLSDAQVINTIAKFTEIDTVRASFTKPDYGTIFPGSRIFDYVQLIICVRNTNCISNVNIIEDEEDI